MRSRWLTSVLAVVLASACSSSSARRATVPVGPTHATRLATTSSAEPPTVHWVRTWAASPQAPEPPISTPSPATFRNQTVRQIVHFSVGGHTLRVQFSNVFGTNPLHIGSAHIARAATDAYRVPLSDRALTFSGLRSVFVKPGEAIFSDSVSVDVATETDVAVTIYLPEPTPASTFHALASQQNLVSSTGNYIDRPFPVSSSALGSWFFLTGVDVVAPSSTSTIVALGDSITDGYHSKPNVNHRWPDYLARRLASDATRRDRDGFAVANAGINGNRTLFDTIGPNAISRFERDVLSTPGVKYVVLLEGINNIGLPGTLGRTEQAPSAAQIIKSYETLINLAHSRGLKIFGGTLTPFEDTLIPNYYSKAGDHIRTAVNHWIRTSRRFDAVFDFEAALQDPLHPARLLAQYDSGDHLHPNDAGYEALANAIDLHLFHG